MLSFSFTFFFFASLISLLSACLQRLLTWGIHLLHQMSQWNLTVSSLTTHSRHLLQWSASDSLLPSLSSPLLLLHHHLCLHTEPALVPRTLTWWSFCHTNLFSLDTQHADLSSEKHLHQLTQPEQGERRVTFFVSFFLSFFVREWFHSLCFPLSHFLHFTLCVV